MLQIADGETLDTKIRLGDYRYAVSFERRDTQLWLTYDYAPELTNEMKKCFSGMKWHGYDKPDPIKQWTIRYDYHNRFQLESFMEKKPYKIFDEAVALIEKRDFGETQFKYPLKEHQKDLVTLGLLTKTCLWAAEMGLGKSLSAIELMTQVLPKFVWWVAPNSALYSVKLECQKWGVNFSQIPIRFMTYDGLKKIVKDGISTPPPMIFFDESQKIKNPSAKRTEAAAYVANAMREFWVNPYIIGMTGTPSPKSPLDWYCQCEIICPGFIKEGNIHIFKQRLAITEMKENNYGGSYPELLSWKDDSRKCGKCGGRHDLDPKLGMDHEEVKTVNEVEKLYKRMKGLVIVKLKKDCVELPEIIYDRIHCKKSRELTQAMKMVLKRSKTAIQGLTLCRELSDGFQYVEVENGTEKCPICYGTGKKKMPKYIGPEKTEEFLLSIGVQVQIYTNYEDAIIDPVIYPQYFEEEEQTCPTCNGSGEITKYTKDASEVKGPKDDVLKDLLEEYEDVGRVVIYAGYQASVDRCVRIAGEQGYEVIRLDGRGWNSSFDSYKNPEVLLKIFQDAQALYPKVAFIGHPGSAGTGLTLTASPVIIYFSNDFNGEARMQSVHRIHRLGMDVNRGARIVDIINLPTDEYVLDNLNDKIRLQDMSLGQIVESIEHVKERDEYEIVT